MVKIDKVKEAVMPQKLLLELLDYDSATGYLSWIKRGKGRKFGQVAGCLDKINGYIVIKVNGRRYQAHRLVWLYVHGDFPEGGQPLIDHINGKRDDNRILNLRIISHTGNMRNSQRSSNNISGITGVCRVASPNNSKINPKINYYWRAAWYDENGKQCHIDFSVHQLGEEVAKQAAITHREEQIRLLELDHGIKYSERHGQ